MFDLIDESGADLKSAGYAIKKLDKYGISVASLEIKSDEKSKKIGLDKGEYYIFNSPFIYELGIENIQYLSRLLAEKLQTIFKELKVNKSTRILIIGLGNPDIASDRLGKEVFDNINISPLNDKNRLFKFCPNIFFSTGIDTLKLVKMFAKELKINLIILIDSLTTSNIGRLGTSFQITTNGMTPGSGVNRFGKRINKISTGCDCISIGVPFMIYSSSLNDEFENDLILTPKDVRENVALAGEVIALALKEVIK